MQVGLIADAATPGIYLPGAALKMLGAKVGDYVEVMNPRRDTQVVRELRSLGCAQLTRDDYAYFDQGSLHYLDAELHDNVVLRLSNYFFDAP